MQNQLSFCFPVKTLALSLSGTRCAWNCPYCGSHYLRGMRPAAALDYAGLNRYASVLVSGGCTPRGKVFTRKHLPVLKRLKAAGLRINLHCGLVSARDILAFKPLAAVTSFDFIADPEILELNRLKPKAYLECLERLRAQVTVIPHLMLGINRGRINSEYQALRLLSELQCPALTFLVFKPAPGTPWAGFPPPALESVERVLDYARDLMPHTPFYLGCMRPGGNYRERLDALALRYRFAKIVMPARSTLEQAGSEAIIRQECCAL